MGICSRDALSRLGRVATALPLTLLLLLVAVSPGALAASDTLVAADTAWILVASALVMLMTPGLALFYGGMVRSKNVVSMIMQVFFLLGLVTLQWVAFGYSLAFGPDVGGFIGNLDWAFLNGVSASEPGPYADNIPHQAFMVFQLMFAIITPALILGAVAERIRFRAIVVFTLLWATLVYDPLAHWTWGGGWIGELGALDFAGGLVVHVSSGIAALAAALYLGKRLGHGKEPMRPHNLILVALGTALLWFGWFGFNAGSALAADGVAVAAFVTTHIATAAAVVTWAGFEYARHGRPTILGSSSGAVAGLVAVTPAAGFITPMGALVLGVLAGGLCYFGVRVKERLGFDDALDAFGIHGVGGILGAIGTGLFATVAVNAAGVNGLLAGADGALGLHPENWAAVQTQLVALAAVIAYVFILSLGILFVVDKLVGLRVAPEHEEAGLDVSEHGETGYDGGITAAMSTLAALSGTRKP